MIFDKDLVFLNSGLSLDGVRAARGILICLVILGHIKSNWHHFVHFKHIIYDFHVMAFLMISMLRPVGPFSLSALTSLIKRYLGPMLPISLFAFITFNIFVQKHTLIEVIEIIPIYGLALVSGNYNHFDLSTGLELFWFMYALVGLIVLRMLFAGVTSNRISIFIFAAACHALGEVFVAYIPMDVPAWIGVSMYALPFSMLSLYVAHILSQLRKTRGNVIILLVLVVFLFLCLFWVPGHNYNLAQLRVPTLRTPISYAASVFYVGLAFYLIIIASETRLCKTIFCSLGRLSFGVYLTHMFILFVTNSFLDFFIFSESIRIILQFSITIMFSLAAARLYIRII